MSKQLVSQINFKLDADKKKYVETTLDIIGKQKNIESRGETLYLVLKTYNDTMKQQANVDYSRIKPFECNFLVHYNDEWNCNEPMSTTKKPIQLGDEVEIIRSKCRACFEGHSIAENERKRKLLERSNIIKLQDFYKDFLALTKHGFNVDCVMCKGLLLDKNTVIMSRDGESIYCPHQDMAIVNINDICKEVTNTGNKSKGCEYLISLEHHVNFKDSDVEEKIKEILPKLKQLEDEKETE